MSSGPVQRLNKTDVIEIVQRHLDQDQPMGFRLDVVSEGIQEDADWWYVTVVPTPGTVRSHEYANRLAGVEEKIQDDTGANILLVPTLADD